MRHVKLGPGREVDDQALAKLIETAYADMRDRRPEREKLGMPDDYLTFIVGALAGIITGLAALAAYYTATHQNRLSATGIATDWLRDLRAWASEAVDVLSEATYCCPKDLEIASKEDSALLVRCRFRISALIDRGRFLLPNEREGMYGTHKAGAFQGFRHPALDALVAAERVLDGSISLYAFPDAKKALVGIRREFVSMVQAMLDPRSMNKAVATLLQQAHEDRKQDPTLGGLLPDPARVPAGDEGLLYTASRRYEKSAGGV